MHACYKKRSSRSVFCLLEQIYNPPPTYHSLGDRIFKIHRPVIAHSNLDVIIDAETMLLLTWNDLVALGHFYFA